MSAYPGKTNLQLRNSFEVGVWILLRAFLVLVVSGVIIFSGCVPNINEPKKICAGKQDLFESLSALRGDSHKAVSFRAHGQCFLRYYSGDKKHKDNFSIKLFLHPPFDIYLQGDVAFNPKGIILGSNEEQFWLAIKPKDVSSYWWGKWSHQKGLSELPMSPRILLEALGMAEIEMTDNWALSNEGPYDILTEKTEAGTVKKKVYIYACEYLIRKIKYFDSSGELKIVTEMGNYTEVDDDFFVPEIIKITGKSDKGRDETVKITLGHLRKVQFEQRQLDFIFERPEPRGYKHVFVIINGESVGLKR